MRLWHKVVGQKAEDAWGAGADGDPQEARRQGGAETRGCFSKRPPPHAGSDHTSPSAATGDLGSWPHSVFSVLHRGPHPSDQQSPRQLALCVTVTSCLRAARCSGEKPRGREAALRAPGPAPRGSAPCSRVQWGLSAGDARLFHGGDSGGPRTITVPLAFPTRGDGETLRPLSSPSVVAGTSVPRHSLLGTRSRSCWCGGEGERGVGAASFSG